MSGREGARQWQKVYVFLSSTFNDMHAERDYLVKQLFPQLQEWCERRRLRLVDIDLRWGVTEQDATRNRNVVRVCLNRIDDCRPFFLCFLGQRRGWVPGRNDVSPDTLVSFPALKEHLGAASVTELEILHAVLRPLHGPSRRDSGKPDEYYQSARYAFFYLREPSYLDQLPSDPPLLRNSYTNEGEPEQNTHDDLLANWRNGIIPGSHRPVRPYHAQWDPQGSTPELTLPLQCPSIEPENVRRWRQKWEEEAGVQPSGLELEADSLQAEKARLFNQQLTQGRLTGFRHRDIPLSQVILQDLQAAITERYPDQLETTQLTDLQREIDQQEQFLFLSSDGFIEREGDFEALDRYLEDSSSTPFLLVAPGGAGKSMLLANWIDRLRRRPQDDQPGSLHFRFIGASDGSTNLHSLMRSLLRELKEVTGRIDEEIPDDPMELSEAWPRLLEAVARGGKSLLVIDGLDQLETGLHNLGWIPWQLPPNLKLVGSFRQDEETEALCRRLVQGGQAQLHQVRPFEQMEDRRRLVRAYLSQFLKELDDRLLETLIQSPGAGNPLYLKVVLSELRVFGAFASLEAKIRQDFGDSPVSAFAGLLRRLESDPAYSPIPPSRAVPLLFGLLAHARHGLSIQELTALLVENLGES